MEQEQTWLTSKHILIGVWILRFGISIAEVCVLELSCHEDLFYFILKNELLFFVSVSFCITYFICVYSSEKMQKGAADICSAIN